MSEKLHNKQELIQLQSLPIEAKIQMSQERIREFYEYYDGNVFISFSGGKDSTVLLDIARKMYPNIKAMFVNTGLEYPEIQKFVKKFDNVDIIYPETNFVQVITKYGYPVIGKRQADIIQYAKSSLKKHKYSTRLGLLGVSPHEYKQYGFEKLSEDESNKYIDSCIKSKFRCNKYEPLLNVDFNISGECCKIMKKDPSKKYQRQTGFKPIVATMAGESLLRLKSWMESGCNVFNGDKAKSSPLSFWSDQDILEYIKLYNIEICSVYGDIIKEDGGKLITSGCQRTGCIYCMFGAQSDLCGHKRFKMLKQTHPKQYKYCMGGGEYCDNKWIPNKDGLGLLHVIKTLNSIFGDNYIEY